MIGAQQTIPQFVTETIGDESYSYIPLGNHVVRAIGVCSGRPTFKYTRIEVAFILNRIANGKTVDYIIDAYDDPHLSRGAIHEAISLAAAAFESSPLVSHPLAA